jgi:uncharacterized membrane protein YhhN
VRSRAAALVGVACVAGVVWWSALPSQPPAPWALLSKALAILPLAALVAARDDRGSRWIAVALAVHALGDVVLEVGPFLLALAAFAAGHGLYAAGFLGVRRHWETVGGGAKLALGALALTAGVALPRLLASAPRRLTGPIAVYALLLLVMAGLAQVARRGQPLLALGALGYVASDLLLAWHLFVAPLGSGHALVWPLYWGGQAAIALGWSRDTVVGPTGGAPSPPA